MKKYLGEIFMIIIISLITAGVIIVSNNMNFGMINELHEVTKIVFNSLISLIAIWISGYFILIQLYKNTYPMEIIEKKFLKIVKKILIFSVMSIFLGIIIITIYTNYIAEIY